MEFSRNCSREIFRQPYSTQDSFFKIKMDEEEFSMENCTQSKGFLQEFQHLDHLSMVGSSFSPDLGIQTTGLDLFDPFPNGSSSVGFDSFDFKPPFVENEANGNILGTQENFEAGANGNCSFLSFNAMNPTPLMDEGSSCVTGDSGFHKERSIIRRNNNRNSTNNSSFLSTRMSSRGRKKSKSAKGQWTIEEDRLLVQLVEKFGVRKWSHIAQMLKRRIGKQCRERWHNHLRPDIKKDVWTEEEDRVLIEAHAEIGNKWAEIAKRLPGRTENSIKNHWNATKRRQLSRRKCRTKWPKPSNLLQNYIRSLNFDNESSTGRSRNASSSRHRSGAITGAKYSPASTDDRQLVPYYDFNRVPELALDENCIGHELTILEENGFHMDIPYDVPPLTMQFEVKKELELMEMIPHVNL